MSNILQGTGINYFQLPKAVILSGFLSDLSPSALRMHIFLFYQAQQFSRSDLPITDNQFVSNAGVSLNSVRAGRAELLESGLIQIEPISGGYMYVLCDPRTRQPIPKRKAAAPPTTESPRTGKSAARTRSTPRAGNFFDALTPDEKRRFFEMHLLGKRKQTKGGFMALCPFHPDTHPSLKVETRAGRWYCHGCKEGGGMVDFEMKSSACDAKTALGRIADMLGRHDLINPTGDSSAEQTFNYLDENGELLWQLRRYKGKAFRIFSPAPTRSGWKSGATGIRRVLYRLPEVTKASLVIVNEGEKHCDRCKELFPESDIAATTSAFGAGSWQDDFAPHFEGKSVFIIPDNDNAGRQHAETVARSVEPFALEVKIVSLPDLPPGGDVIDYLDKHSKEELMRECANTPPLKPGVT